MGDDRHELASIGNSRELPERRNSSEDNDQADGVNGELLPSVELLLRPRFGHNRYATRKTAAQGMMDVALLLANASQLKSVVEAGPSHRYFTFLLTLIIISIILQVIAGILLLWIGSRESKSKDDDDVNEHTNKLNNISIGMIFLITVVNIFIASFGIGDPTGPHLETAEGVIKSEAQDQPLNSQF